MRASLEGKIREISILEWGNVSYSKLANSSILVFAMLPDQRVEEGEGATRLRCSERPKRSHRFGSSWPDAHLRWLPGFARQLPGIVGVPFR